jgi:hypothetical protein
MDYLAIGRDAIERCLQKHADVPFAQGEIDSAGDLVEAGVPKDQIVLAFQHKSRRKWGEFAPA